MLINYNWSVSWKLIAEGYFSRIHKRLYGKLVAWTYFSSVLQEFTSIKSSTGMFWAKFLWAWQRKFKFFKDLKISEVSGFLFCNKNQFKKMKTMEHLRSFISVGNRWVRCYFHESKMIFSKILNFDTEFFNKKQSKLSGAIVCKK